MAKAPKKTTRPEPFAHAGDLPAAYRELAAALAALVKLEETGPGRFRAFHARMVTSLSPCAIWLNADEKIAAWKRLGDAARRVEVARSGMDSARRTVGFKRLRAA